MTESKLKRLSENAIHRAIEKARHYRLLNQPKQAASICLDVLAIQPEHQDALIEMTLAVADQLESGQPGLLEQAQETAAKLQSDYHRAYYSALVSERQALALLHRRGKRSSLVALQFFNEAMAKYDTAMQHKPADEDESVLRWNFCQRMIDKHQLNEIDPEELEDLGIE